MDNFKIHSYLFETTKRLAVNKSLDAAMLRSKANAMNISNVDVPGYNRKEVAFEEMLRKCLNRKVDGVQTDDKHIEISKKAAMRKLAPEVYVPVDPAQASGANNVDIDIENAKMAENQILYNYGIKFSSFEKLKSSITSRH